MTGPKLSLSKKRMAFLYLQFGAAKGLKAYQVKLSNKFQKSDLKPAQRIYSKELKIDENLFLNFKDMQEIE
jgi:hypothetical protein